MPTPELTLKTTGLAVDGDYDLTMHVPVVNGALQVTYRDRSAPSTLLTVQARPGYVEFGRKDGQPMTINNANFA